MILLSPSCKEIFIKVFVALVNVFLPMNGIPPSHLIKKDDNEAFFFFK